MESAKLSLPAAPDKYVAELPKDFKAPEGMSFEINQNDPSIAQGREWAHRHGVSQEAFSELIGIHAAGKISEKQQFDAGFKAEVAKLGPNAPARVDAVTTWLTAMGGEKFGTILKSVLGYAPRADVVEGFEHLMRKVTSQGGASFTQSGRETAPAPMSDEKWNSMSYAEKRDYTKRNKAA